MYYIIVQYHGKSVVVYVFKTKTSRQKWIRLHKADMVATEIYNIKAEQMTQMTRSAEVNELSIPYSNEVVKVPGHIRFSFF